MIEEDKISNPFDKPYIDNYCNEKVPTEYLTKEDIKELGFLRSNPMRKIYQHNNNPNLYLEEIYEKDYSIKDLVVERVKVFTKTTLLHDVITVLYDSAKPNKEDIQQVINDYAA